ncbi:ATP-binding protein [Natronoarchaeum mannanilyticum]|uniref:ATP-binding protein n=1 Tax=Natronoarchaeum mannanilyticum TaxID=926360 RepID=A0AAV3T9H3_9EURY
MPDSPYPESVSEWSKETIEALEQSNHEENQHIEYKHHLQYPDNGNEKSKSEWRSNLEREFTAFANAGGGVIVFGINDDVQPAPFERPNMETGRIVSQLVHKTTPPVKTEVGAEIEYGEGGKRIILPVRVFEATRKPVATADAAYYVRSNEGKHTMTRQLLESLYVERDRRQQAIRKLELEIDRFNSVFEKQIEDRKRDEAPHPFHAFNIEGLKDALRENTHLYAQDLDEEIQSVFDAIGELELYERRYKREIRGEFNDPYRDSVEDFNRDTESTFRQYFSDLNQELEKLSEAAGI